jgi:hypothetical protein
MMMIRRNSLRLTNRLRNRLRNRVRNRVRNQPGDQPRKPSQVIVSSSTEGNFFLA